MGSGRVELHRVQYWSRYAFWYVHGNDYGSTWMLHTLQDGVMNAHESNPAIRKGQFLWMEPVSRTHYLQNLKKKIAAGYYFSDKVISQITDELAPVIEDISFNKQ